MNLYAALFCFCWPLSLETWTPEFWFSSLIEHYFLIILSLTCLFLEDSSDPWIVQCITFVIYPVSVLLFYLRSLPEGPIFLCCEVSLHLKTPCINFYRKAFPETRLPVTYSSLTSKALPWAFPGNRNIQQRHTADSRVLSVCLLLWIGYIRKSSNPHITSFGEEVSGSE